MGPPAAAPWSVVVAVQDVPETGKRFDLAADEQVRAEVARIAGLRALPRFEASFDVSRRGRDGLHVTGSVSATVGQTCVVTLDAIESEVNEAVDLIFAPAPDGDRENAGDTRQEGIEPMVGGRVDLGAIATEFLVLGVDPYPRKPGVAFEAPSAAQSGGNPFAALSALKGRNKDGR
jgi:uncharacterized metal-binding protein YceD (DUF177 family)